MAGRFHHHDNNTARAARPCLAIAAHSLCVPCGTFRPCYETHNITQSPATVQPLRMYPPSTQLHHERMTHSSRPCNAGLLTRRFSDSESRNRSQTRDIGEHFPVLWRAFTLRVMPLFTAGGASLRRVPSTFRHARLAHALSLSARGLLLHTNGGCCLMSFQAVGSVLVCFHTVRIWPDLRLLCVRLCASFALGEM